MKRFAYACITFCFLFLVAASHPAAACSGDDCGCGIENNACRAECAANPDCTGACRTACIGRCVREMRDCSTSCCASTGYLFDQGGKKTNREFDFLGGPGQPSVIRLEGGIPFLFDGRENRTDCSVSVR